MWLYVITLTFYKFWKIKRNFVTVAHCHSQFPLYSRCSYNLIFRNVISSAKSPTLSLPTFCRSWCVCPRTTPSPVSPWVTRTMGEPQRVMLKRDPQIFQKSRTHLRIMIVWTRMATWDKFQTQDPQLWSGLWTSLLSEELILLDVCRLMGRCALTGGGGLREKPCNNYVKNIRRPSTKFSRPGSASRCCWPLTLT